MGIIVERKLLAFDFLRMIAILTVLLTHSTSYLSCKYLKYMIAIFNPFFAQIGLGLFIFISGYLISYNNCSISSIKDVLFFYKKRILRIFPLYWAALAIFTLLFYIYPHFIPSQFIVSNASTLFSIHNLIIHILGMQILLAPTYSSPVFTLYFIGIIISFYMIYPFLTLYSKTTSHFLLLSLLVFVTFAFISGTLGIIDKDFFSFYPIFIAGVVVSRVNALDRFIFSPYFAFMPFFFASSLVLQDRIFLFLDPRISITAVSASSGTINSSLAITMIEKFAASIGLSYDTVTFFITFLFFNISVIMFCIAQLWIANICINEKLPSLIISVITHISSASYTVYLFHRPILSIWISIVNHTQISSLLQDGITISLIIPLMFVTSYYIQHMESLFRVKLLTKPKK